MKKLFSLILSISLAAACLSFGCFNAYANTKKDAPTVTLGGNANVYVDASTPKYYVEFEPTYTGWFEFASLYASYDGNVLASIYDFEDEVHMQSVNDSQNPYLVTGAYLTAGDSYYLVIETTGSAYSSVFTVRAHSHNYSVVQNYPAVYDANDASLCQNGGSYSICAYCGDTVTNAVYYYPKKITLKTKTFTYNGKAKKTTVTAYDSAGGVIPSSQYTVKYKNNKKPGYGTVTVTFKGNYSGAMTAKITIKPKKPTLSSVKTNAKKKITVKWKKDSNVTGYQIQYSTSKKFTSKTTKSITIKKKSTTSKTVSKLKSKKKYYVRIRSYKQSGGKKIYGAWSKAKSIKVK